MKARQKNKVASKFKVKDEINANDVEFSPNFLLQWEFLLKKDFDYYGGCFMSRKNISHQEAAESIRELIQYFDDNPDKAKDFLVSTGVYTESGELTDKYKGV